MRNKNLRKACGEKMLSTRLLQSKEIPTSNYQRISKAVKYLIQAKRKEDLFPFKSLHFEALHGDKE